MMDNMTKAAPVGSLTTGSDGPSSASNGDVDDEPSARFEDFTPGAGPPFTNGSSSSQGAGGPMYYITEAACPTAGYYNSGLANCSQVSSCRC